jgi:hypothetical protein
LNDTGNKEAIESLTKMGSMKNFAQIKVSTSNAEEKVAKLNEIKNKAIDYFKK